MAGVEEDAVPPRRNTVQFCSDHILTAPANCLSHLLFAVVLVDSQRMGEKSKARFTVKIQ